MDYALDAVREDLGQGAWVSLLERFVDHDAALMSTLRETLPLGPQTIRLAGKEIRSPRLVSWHGDPEAYYRYSGRTFKPNPWTPELLAIKERVDSLVFAAFNSVLVNFYRDGQDSMGEHADAEPELGPAPGNILIASVSLGARRRFLLRHMQTKRVHEFSLGNGNLFVMGGTTQRYFKHRVPRTTGHVGPRINLTFRVVGGRSSARMRSWSNADSSRFGDSDVQGARSDGTHTTVWKAGSHRSWDADAHGHPLNDHSTDHRTRQIIEHHGGDDLTSPS